MKFNFESEEEMIEYLKENIQLEIEPGYYSDAEAVAKLFETTLASRYVYVGRCNCSRGRCVMSMFYDIHYTDFGNLFLAAELFSSLKYEQPPTPPNITESEEATNENIRLEEQS